MGAAPGLGSPLALPMGTVPSTHPLALDLQAPAPPSEGCFLLEKPWMSALRMRGQPLRGAGEPWVTLLLPTVLMPKPHPSGTTCCLAQGACAGPNRLQSYRAATEKCLWPEAELPSKPWEALRPAEPYPCLHWSYPHHQLCPNGQLGRIIALSMFCTTWPH